MSLSVSSETWSIPTTRTSAAYRHTFFRSIEAAGRDWDAAAPPDDIFLQRPYLSVLENNPPKGMLFGYLVFYKNEHPVGVALCQIKSFRADESLNEPDAPTQCTCFFTAVGQWFKRRVAGQFAFNVLVCGNLLLTGEHGYYFDKNRVTPDAAIGLLEKSLIDATKILEQDKMKIAVLLVKDLAQAREKERKFLENQGFTQFCVQPNMILELPFPSFNDYLGAMTTKYRTRAKRAFKKGEAVERRELSLAEIQRELPRIYALYCEIAQNAGFNMVDLNEYYLAALKRDFGAYFRLFGCYYEGKLIAFYTTIQNGDELEAHFLGYDKDFNHDLQLYQNILYDLARHGIEAKCKRVIFARTALEIKSSVGAEPHDLYCYLKHQNSLVNRFTETVLDYYVPEEVWQPRHPFRDMHESQ
jgi:Acetyltransferase (GNAT) domain